MSKEKDMSISLPGEWVLQDVLGPVLSEIGKDLNKLYSIGRDKIILAAHRKIENKKDGKKVNLRVTRDVLWNGAFTDESICAEYFGGILASSRSTDGKNDDAIQYSSVIQSLSSKQIHLHYIIYNCFNKLLIKNKDKNLNVGKGSELQNKTIWFDSEELLNELEINIMIDLPVLYKQGLIKTYTLNQYSKDGKTLYYTNATPSTIGVLLFTVAYNKLDNWSTFPAIDFGDFKDIKLPVHFSYSQKELFNSKFKS